MLKQIGGMNNLHPFLLCALIFSFVVLFLSSTVESYSESSSQSILQLPSDIVDGSDVCLEEVASSSSSSSSSCPVRCFRPDPVCGEDGVTYWCGCADAHCAGTRVAKLGHCNVRSGGSGPFSGQALLLVHYVWLIVLGFAVLCGFL